MKYFIKLFVVVLVAAFLSISCSEKGGTIEITNQYNDSSGILNANAFIIVKGIDIIDAAKDLASGKGTPISKGETKTVSFNEDGVYTVVALFPAGFTSPATLLGGNTVRVTIK